MNLGIQRAMMLVDRGRPQRALEALSDDPDPTTVSWWWLRGVALRQLDRPAEAEDAARAGLALDPEFTPLYDVLAGSLADADKLTAAEQVYRAGLERDPEDTGLLFGYAGILALAGHQELAEQLWQRGAASDPNSVDAHLVRMSLRFFAGDDAGMKDAALQALAEDPHSHTALHGLGISLHAHGDFAGAEARAREAVAADPSNPHSAAFARLMIKQNHWLVLPLRPLRRLGFPLALVLFLASSAVLYKLGLPEASLALLGGWLALMIYSWIAPGLVDRAVA